MKQQLVGTSLGGIAMSFRDLNTVLRSALGRPEALGTIANDQMAGLLTTRLCCASKVFLDIGAHIGSITGEVARHLPSVRIVAFEPIPDKVARLRQRFPGVEVHGCALADHEGEAPFFINTAESGFSSLDRPAAAGSSRIVEIRVPLKTLDGLIQSDQVDLMKIDVEGAELGVLRGADRLVAASRPTIMFESGPAPGESVEPKNDLWQWFADRDYVILVPNRLAHTDPGLSRDGFAESHLYPRRTTNYFAVARERRIELRDRARQILRIVA